MLAEQRLDASAYLPVLVFSITLFLSALLLFSVQPLFGKMLLPLLGGSPSVWITSMLFFQAALLIGYGYAYGTTHWLSPTQQGLLHICLLTLTALQIPIGLPGGLEAPQLEDPTLWQLAVMLIALGAPFTVLSGSAPMIQRWFASSAHPWSSNPYFLYAASNLGSLVALASYPFLVEPLVGLDRQADLWSWGYLLLILFTLLTLLIYWRQRRRAYGENGSESLIPSHRSASRAPLSWRRRLLWLLLSFTTSSLLLGVTSYITTDLASVPLLWLMPLSIYVASFVIAFSRRTFVSLKQLLFIQAVLIAAMLVQRITDFGHAATVPLIIHLSLFAATALVCHLTLAERKPKPSRLTEFYLIIALGGAFGGLFNAVVAPQLFVMPIEYALVLALAAILRYTHKLKRTSTLPTFKTLWLEFKALARDSEREIIISTTGWVVIGTLGCMLFIQLFPFSAVYYLLAPALAIGLIWLHDSRFAFAFTAAVGLMLFPWEDWSLHRQHLLRERNYFGVITVTDQAVHTRRLLHGTTIHGAQPLEERYRLTPISYYHPSSGIGDAFGLLDQRGVGAERIAGLGLGVGSIACFSRLGRQFDFFEIDPDIAEIAEDPTLFTYLSDCGSPYQILLGDGRLQIAEQPDNYYDLIVLDVFSSDNIPVHVMTTEAFQIYFRKLKEDGVIVMNLSNRYLQLQGVVAAIAQDLEVAALFRVSGGGEVGEGGARYNAAESAILARKLSQLDALPHRDEWQPYTATKMRAWSDDFADIASALFAR